MQTNDDNKAQAEQYYTRGLKLWQEGNHAGAITCYEHAVDLDPDSPARHALELARDVMDFFNPDIFNP